MVFFVARSMSSAVSSTTVFDWKPPPALIASDAAATDRLSGASTMT